MEFTYTPRRLIQTKEAIIIQHPLENNNVEAVEPSTDLMNLIIRLASLELFQVKKNALALTEEEVRTVAGYLPYNYYNVEMKNLFLIFQYRSNKRLCSILYNQWQDSYSNRDCNKYILEELLVKDEQFIMLLRANNIGEVKFAEILKNEDIPTQYGLELKKHNFAQGKTLKEKLEFLGVRGDSRLYTDCEFLFYTFCDREDYLSCDKASLLVVVKKYSNSQLRQFLLNLLPKLNLKELGQFPQIAQYLTTVTGDNQTDKFNSFFKGFSPELIQKYNDWVNSYKVEEYFGYDERSLFWKEFRFVNVIKYKYSNSVVMEFDKYVAIEFLGVDAGPAYIYKKAYYNSEVKKKLVGRTYDNYAMRMQLYHNTSYEDEGMNIMSDYVQGTRLTHRHPWEYKFQTVLIRNHVTEKLIY